MPNSRVRRSPRRPTGRTRPTRATTDLITTVSPLTPGDATSSRARTSIGSEQAGSTLHTLVEPPEQSISDSFRPKQVPLNENQLVVDLAELDDSWWDWAFLNCTESSNDQTDLKSFACAPWDIDLGPPQSGAVDISPQFHQLPSPPESHRCSPSSFPSEDGGYDMGTEEAAPRSELVCERHGMSFRRKADLERHVAKERQAFICEVPDCPARKDGKGFRFGSLSDKKRHYYEIHHQDLEGNPLQLHDCPWSSCNRHRKGFTRSSNLIAHIRSRHDGKWPPAEQDPITPVASPRVEVTDGPSRQAVVFQQQKSPNSNGNNSTYGSAQERTIHRSETHNEVLPWLPEGATFSGGDNRGINVGQTYGNISSWQDFTTLGSTNSALVQSSATKTDPLTEGSGPTLGLPDVADVLGLPLQNDDEVMQAYLEDFHGSYAQLKNLKREMDDLQEDLKRRQMELKRKQEQYIGLRTVVDHEGSKVRKRKAARRDQNETAGSAMRTNRRDESMVIDSR